MDKLRRSEEENEENVLRQKSEAYENWKTRISLHGIGPPHIAKSNKKRKVFNKEYSNRIRYSNKENTPETKKETLPDPNNELRQQLLNFENSFTFKNNIETPLLKNSKEKNKLSQEIRDLLKNFIIDIKHVDPKPESLTQIHPHINTYDNTPVTKLLWKKIFAKPQMNKLICTSLNGLQKLIKQSNSSTPMTIMNSIYSIAEDDIYHIQYHHMEFPVKITLQKNEYYLPTSKGFRQTSMTDFFNFKIIQKYLHQTPRFKKESKTLNRQKQQHDYSISYKQNLPKKQQRQTTKRRNLRHAPKITPRINNKEKIIDPKKKRRHPKNPTKNKTKRQMKNNTNSKRKGRKKLTNLLQHAYKNISLFTSPKKSTTDTPQNFYFQN